MKAAERPKKKGDAYHHGDLRRSLLLAARAEIAANGAHNLSLSSLARRAGVAQSAPYRHFADRDELLAAVAAEGFEAFTKALRDAEAAPGGEKGALKRMAAAYLRFGEENVEVYRLMFASALTPNAARASALREAATNSFRPLLERVTAGTSSTKRARQSAYAIWAQLHGLVMLKADGFLEDPSESLLAALSL